MEAYKILESDQQNLQASSADVEKKLSRKLKEMMEVQELTQQVRELTHFSPPHTSSPLLLPLTANRLT